MTQLKDSKTEKIIIYLADLVHNYIGKGPFMFPINIGYVKSYINDSIYKDKVEIKLFKYPDKLLQEIEKNKPHIIGLSNYAWNEDLNSQLLKYIKQKYPEMITVMGGPNIHIRSDLIIEYLRNQPYLDFYVIHKGEPGFFHLMESYFNSGKDINIMKESKIKDVAFYDKKNDRVLRGEETLQLKDLGVIPSPYLTRVMDEFFEDNLIPNLETNRGCPYPCTFCVWGDLDYQKMSLFPFERITEELNYITRKVSETKNTNILCISDSNFGIFQERDYELSKIIRGLYEKYGYPRKVTTFWAKNKSDGIKKIATTFGELASVDASLQSMNPETLKEIKRDNISQQAYKDLLVFFHNNNIDSDAEMVLGMPFETRESHLNALRELMDMDAGQIIVYHCRLLNGAEMSLPEYRQRNGIKTKFRLIDTCFGEYNGFKSFEVEEMVKSTNHMSEEDLFYFRALQWLVQFTWNYKYYRGLLKYVQANGINPIDFLIYLLENIKNAPDKVKKLMREFDFDSRTEWFESREDLVRHYSKEDNFRDLTNGSFGKMNFKYTFKALIDCHNEFDVYLAQIVKELLSKKSAYLNEDYKQIIDDIIKFESMLRINFSNLELDKDFELEEEKNGVFHYDILQWKKDRYEKNINEYVKLNNIAYRFYLPKDQINALHNNIKQFKNVNINFTLRKMSEYMRISDLFYQIESSEESKKYKIKMEDHVFHTSAFAQ
ncbi:cobalamin-dependent protein [Candidatus Woesearchaeota archaeon]|nr:cobalamin-dependent protein [Candidatus Woesearchaeota archaeon]